MPILPALRPRLAVLPLALSLLCGCGTMYQPGRIGAFELDPAKQIDDEDIRKAYEAEPQLPREMRVAYYTFDSEIAGDLEKTFAKIPGVVSVYRIPSLMVNGQRRIEERNRWGPPREVTVKKLRLFAARAHADVLFVVDRGYYAGGANGLAALNLFILPIFFLPFLDNTVEGYAEAFVIDVRNGYLYGHVSEDDTRGERYATIYATSARTVVDEQWAVLRDALNKGLSRIVADAHAKAAANKAAVPVVVPAPLVVPAPAAVPTPAVAPARAPTPAVLPALAPPP